VRSMTRTTHDEDQLLDELAAALDSFADGPSSVSSIRQPEGLRRAMQAAVSLGWARNANEGVVESLREELTSFCRSRALEAHYREHPETRPSLAGVAVALAELDHDPLADEPELIERAAKEIVAVRPDADADDVLIWAASLRYSRA
jgi:hypothetical protein